MTTISGGDRWCDGPDPLGPSGGPGDISFDRARFEQEFWTYVREREPALA
jgi:hypothetical protein